LANNSSKIKKLLKTAVQILVTLIALTLVLRKTDIGEIGRIIQGANIGYLLLSLLFFNISKVFNAVRLRRFFKAIGLELSWVYNLKLYYLGMFYNLFLPGGIGGDGYKIFVLKKNHEVKTINVFHAVFWDRMHTCKITGFTAHNLSNTTDDLVFHQMRAAFILGCPV